MSRVSVVTGGTKGIGLAVARRLSRAGGRVYLTYWNDESAATEARSACEAAGADVVLLRADAADPRFGDTVVAAVRDNDSRIDVAVHCAVRGAGGKTVSISPEEWITHVQANGLSFILLVRALDPLLESGSSVFFLTSAGARDVVRNYAPIGIPKALAEAGARYLAAELAPRGIRVNAISPGAMDTAAFRSVFPDPEPVLQAVVKATPARRLATPDDVAAVIEWLSGQDGSMLVGDRIDVDGGAHLY